MALLPITVPVFDADGLPVTTDVKFMVVSLSALTYFDFGSQYGGSGDNTFKSYASASTPKLTLAKLDASNLDGYYGIIVSGSVVSLDLDDLADGDYLLVSDTLNEDPKGRYVTQIGVQNGRLAENIASTILGNGVTQVTVVVKEVDTSGDPIPNVYTVVRTTAGVLVANNTTDVNGSVVFNLDAGSYLVYLSRVGSADVYDNPYTLTVSTTTMSVEYYGSVTSPDTPGVGGTTRVYAYVRDLGITAREDIEVRVRVNYPDEAYTPEGVIVSGSTVMTTTDDEGYFYFDLIPQKFLETAGVIYRIEIHESDLLVDVSAGTSITIVLPCSSKP